MKFQIAKTPSLHENFQQVLNLTAMLILLLVCMKSQHGPHMTGILWFPYCLRLAFQYQLNAAHEMPLPKVICDQILYGNQ